MDKDNDVSKCSPQERGYNAPVKVHKAQAVDWSGSDGLKSSIVAALSLAVSGVGVSHR